MKRALFVPNFGDFAEPRTFADLAAEGEAAGWDGLYIWDHILIEDGTPMADPWVALAAAATVTERIRLGPMVTPVPRRHPWKLARELVSLDRLSGGSISNGYHHFCISHRHGMTGWVEKSKRQTRVGC